MVARRSKQTNRKKATQRTTTPQKAARKKATTVRKRVAQRAPRARALPRSAPPKAVGPQAGYYRFPTIHDDRIAFCSDDDLWIVSAEGGVARRLTVGKGPVQRALFSPNGRWIAFLGLDEGAAEVYVVPAEGGDPQRLTHLASMTMPVAWSADGREIIFASDHGRPFMGHHQLYAVPVAGGPHRALNVGPARAITHEPDGKGVAIARNGGDPARWKRYRGGTAGTLWIDRDGSGNFREILSGLAGNIASPMWIGSRIYFIADPEGIGNLYSCRPDGRDLQRHTDHDDFYARFPSSDGRRIVYHAGSDIFVFDTTTNESRRLPIEIRSPRPQRQRKFVPGAAYLEDYDPHPAGHSIALTVRGRPVAMGLWEGPATEFGIPWRGRHRLARWLNDGKRLVAVTDEAGEEQLEIFTPGTGPRGSKVNRLDLGVDLGRIVDLVVAPAPPQPEGADDEAGTGPTPGGAAADSAAPVAGGQRGKKLAKKVAKKIAKKAGQRAGRAGAKPAPAPDLIALTNQRQELWVVDLTKKRARRIDHSTYFRILGLSWSPDARWIAYGFAVGRRHQAIRIANVETGTTHQVTSGDFLDYAPCFDPEGKYLYFLSMRTYDPVYEMVRFDLGFPRSVRPYLITLRADEPSPFTPAPRPLGPAKAAGVLHAKNPWEVVDAAQQAKEAAGAKKKGAKAPEPVRIEFDGIEQRVLAFPVAEGRYRAIAAIPGKAFFLADPIEGSLGGHWASVEPPAKSAIEVYDLKELKSGTLVSGITDFAIARDRKTLVYRSKYRLRAVLAASEPGKLPSDDSTGRPSGWIDLSRVRCSVEPGGEWRQMFAEAWRLQRDQFWTPDMSRVNWERVYDRYFPLVDRVSARGEFSDLIWEMQAELGTSHCYEFGGDYPRPPVYPVGFLGADLTFDEDQGAWKVVAIPEGDPWNPQQASPLAAPGLQIRPGTLIHAINGRVLGRQLSPMEGLLNLAGQEVWLAVSDPQAPARGRARKTKGRARTKTRTVTIKTLGSEYALRYRAWVEGNRRRVHEESKGRVGYLHIPNMGPLGYSEFHRYFLAEIDRDALIVDVRNNGGGHVSQLLLEKLLRRRVGWDISRYHAPEPYPSEAPKGPMVALTDELAGSDGDIFSHSWKLYKLGPLVGKRTWGGVVGIWPRHLLVDGTITTQPEFAFWFEDVGWDVENYGTEPDIEVDFPPQDHAAGRDPQLERGLKEATKLLVTFAEKLPDMRKRPSRALPRLPRRKR